MPPKKRTGKHPGSGGPAGASIPGVKALLQACLKAMAIDVHRLANDDDVGALRKALDDALIRSSGLKRAVDVAALPEWGDTPCPESETRGMAAVCELFNRGCFTTQESLGIQSRGGVPNFEADPVMALAMKNAIPMVEVRILLAKMATFLATKDASQQGRNMLFLVQPPAEDFAVVIFVNRVCLWTTPDGPVPALDVAYLFEEKRKIGNNNPDHPVFKTVNQLMQHAVGGVHVVETEFTTDGAKAVALVLERTASILGAKACEAMKRRWSLPPFAMRRMSATALVPIKVLTASDIHKVERRAGRSCESCSTPLPVTASKCSACQEVHYCGPECQKAHWPEHQKSCRKAPVVSFDEAVEVRHGHNPFGSSTSVPQGHVTATFPLNGGARADEMVPRDMNKAGKLPAMPSSGFIVKVQVGLDRPDRTPIVVYPRGKRFETFVPVDAPCHRPLATIVQARGFSGLKLYMWALRKSDDTFLVNIKDFPDQDQGW